MQKKRRTWRFKMAVSATVAIGSLLLVELLLRVIGVGFPRPYVADEFIGTRLQPGFHGWFSKEGGAWVQANSRGFRDDEHGPEKPKDELRIAVLGDSYVEAAQVALGDTFWKVLEAELNNGGRSRKSATVMAFGVSGFGTAQELLTYRHYVTPLRPDIVVLAMTLTNDLRNNSKALEPVQERPFFVLADGKLVEDRSFLQHPVFLSAQDSGTQFKTSLINASNVLQVVAEWKGRRGQPTPKKPGQPTEAGLDESIYRAPISANWTDAWAVTESMISLLNEEVTAAGAKLVVVTLTDGMQVHPDRSVYEEFCRTVGTADLTYADQRIANVCDTLGVAVLNLAGPMQERAIAEQTFFHGFTNTAIGEGHWNVDGHRVAGKLLADFLRNFESDRK
jgi:hypothetical protein